MLKFGKKWILDCRWLDDLSLGDPITMTCIFQAVLQMTSSTAVWPITSFLYLSFVSLSLSSTSIYCPSHWSVWHSFQNIEISSFMYHRVNNIRGSKWWQNFHFGVNLPLYTYSYPCYLIDDNKISILEFLNDNVTLKTGVMITENSALPSQE